MATVTEPPGPEPRVAAVIRLPSVTERLPAPTVTLPPGPEPEVADVIVALSATVICGAVTATVPALPIDPMVVSVPVRDPKPLRVKGPATSTVTRPAFPVLGGKSVEG